MQPGVVQSRVRKTTTFESDFPWSFFLHFLINILLHMGRCLGSNTWYQQPSCKAIETYTPRRPPQSPASPSVSVETQRGSHKPLPCHTCASLDDLGCNTTQHHCTCGAWITHQIPKGQILPCSVERSHSWAICNGFMATSSKSVKIPPECSHVQHTGNLNKRI